MKPAVELVVFNMFVTIHLIRNLTSHLILSRNKIEGMRHNPSSSVHDLHFVIIRLSTNDYHDSREAKMFLAEIWGAAQKLERTRGADRWAQCLWKAPIGANECAHRAALRPTHGPSSYRLRDSYYVCTTDAMWGW